MGTRGNLEAAHRATLSRNTNRQRDVIRQLIRLTVLDLYDQEEREHLLRRLREDVAALEKEFTIRRLPPARDDERKRHDSDDS